MSRLVNRMVLAMILCSFAVIGVSQVTPKQFVIDNSKPYVYIAFDHMGKREPVENWESPNGLWLRLVNNCNLPIRVKALGVGTADPGTTIAFDVVRTSFHIVSPDEPQGNPPLGYEAENAAYVTIPPQKDLLFSVPAETVTKAWHIEVRFILDLPSPSRGESHPQSLVDFTWNDIPQQSGKLQPYQSEPSSARNKSARPDVAFLLHESGHTDSPKPR